MGTEKKPTIGIIGSGWVGGTYMQDFMDRGYGPLCYSLDPAHIANKEKVASCDFVLIAVPTPTTPKGFDDSIIRDVLPLVGEGKIAVIKSSVVPGTTSKLQEEFPEIIILYSPEFLSEATAKKDVAEPFSNIVGMAKDTDTHRKAAEAVLKILPRAPYSAIMTSSEAEIVKYSHNASGYVQIIFFNAMYDIAKSLEVSWENIGKALKADPFISNRYSEPVHKTGRGAGGSCFIKDYKALADTYEKLVGDSIGLDIFRANERKNIELLKASNKDINLLKKVYGDDSVS